MTEGELLRLTRSIWLPSLTPFPPGLATSSSSFSKLLPIINQSLKFKLVSRFYLCQNGIFLTWTGRVIDQIYLTLISISCLGEDSDFFFGFSSQIYCEGSGLGLRLWVAFSDQMPPHWLEHTALLLYTAPCTLCATLHYALCTVTTYTVLCTVQFQATHFLVNY